MHENLTVSYVLKCFATRIYICLVMCSYGSIPKIYALIVFYSFLLEPPVIESSSPTGEIKVVKGKDDKGNNLTPSYSGSVFVSAGVGCGRKRDRSIYLYIPIAHIYLPIFQSIYLCIFLSIYLSIYLCPGSTVTMRCRASGFPEPQVSTVTKRRTD